MDIATENLIDLLANFNESEKPTSEPEPRFRFSDKAVSLTVLNLQTLQREYPALNDTAHGRFYRRMLSYLMFSHQRNEHDWPLVSQNVIAELAEVPLGTLVSAEQYLRLFSENVFSLEWTGWSHEAGVARHIKSPLPQVVEDIVASEVVRSPTEPRVWLVTNAKVSEKTLRTKAHLERDYYASLATCHREGTVERRYQDYLNAQSPHLLFKQLELNLPKVAEAWKAMPVATLRGRRKKRAAGRVLADLYSKRLPVYSTGANSARIFALGYSANNLPKELRNLLFEGCWSLDIVSCQLTIVARLWNCPKLRAFLAGDESIWERLYSAVGVDSRFKGVLKTNLFSIIFGMTISALKRQLRIGSWEKVKAGERYDPESDSPIALGSPERATTFLADELIQELISQRDQRLQEIKDKGYVVLAGGESKDRFDNKKEPTILTDRQLLGLEVQSYEMAVVAGTVGFLESHPDIRVLAHLHDGLIIRVTDKTKERRLLERLQEELKTKARSYGIEMDTKLEEIGSTHAL